MTLDKHFSEKILTSESYLGECFSLFVEGVRCVHVNLNPVKREEIKKQMTARHRKQGNCLKQESIRQKTMKGIAGGLHPAVDKQSPATESESEYILLH